MRVKLPLRWALLLQPPPGPSMISQMWTVERSAIWREVKLAHFSCVRSITKIVSDKTMQAAVASEN